MNKHWCDVLQIHPAAEHAEPAHFRAQRTFRINSCQEVETLPPLPDRIRVCGGFTTLGCRELIHTDKSKTTTPWIAGGLYRAVDQSGALYLLEVRSILRGRPLFAWCYRPIFRIKARAEVMS
jgi:hypothetical protein